MVVLQGAWRSLVFELVVSGGTGFTAGVYLRLWVQQSWDGVNTPPRTVTDNGPDGSGGGHLKLDVQLAVGDLEVTR